MSKLPEQGEFCLNCGAQLQGPYCAACGQKSLEKKHESFWKTLGHFLGDFVHFDSHIFRTAVPLLFKPGFLPNEFLAGKRVKYFNPLRMYIFLSFLFFFLSLSFRKEVKNEDIQVKGIEEADSLVQGKLDTAVRYAPIKLSFDSTSYKNLGEYDSMQQALPENKRDGYLLRTFIRKSLQTKERVKREGGAGFVSEMIEGFKHNYPKMAFVLLPFFALLLKLLYRKNKMYYAEHLIVTVYFYDFFFLLGVILFFWSLLPDPVGEWDSKIFSAALFAYLWVMLKKVYENSWTRTLVKMLLLSMTFGMLLLFATIANLAVAFWLV